MTNITHKMFTANMGGTAAANYIGITVFTLSETCGSKCGSYCN